MGSAMASLYKSEFGDLAEFLSILARSGGNSYELVEGFKKRPNLVPTWVDYGHKLLSGKINPNRYSLSKNDDASYGLVAVGHNLSDEQVIAAFMADGWTCLEIIRAGTRLPVRGKSSVVDDARRSVEVRRLVLRDQVWFVDKIVDGVGVSALDFDLEDLYNLVVGHEDELMGYGIDTIHALGVRFLGADNSECTVYANLCERTLSLVSTQVSLGGYLWLGSSKQ